jgi:DNA-binding response OmpR family regulator
MNPKVLAILLIEKDEVTLEIYQRELSKSFNVFAYTEIDGVLETVKNHDIRAVVIEPEICSGQGWDLIDSIQKNYKTRFIPVIVCSTRDAYSEGPGREVAKYLTKPVLPKTLREITLEVLGLKDAPRKSS